MQQNLFSETAGQNQEDNKIHLGTGLTIQIIEGFKPGARLYRLDVLIKTVDLSGKIAKRLFIVEVVELGANKTKLAKALGVSRQTIHNYEEIQKNFGREGLSNSYHPAKSKSREKQRKLNKEKLPKGNKARLLEEIRRKEREEKEQKVTQLSLFSSDVAEDIHNIISSEQPFSEVHDWKASRYAGVFLYLICLISGSRWLEFVGGHFGNAYKIFMVFVLMVARNVSSIEQLKNIRSRESGLILGLKRLPSSNFSKSIGKGKIKRTFEALILYYGQHEKHTGSDHQKHSQRRQRKSNNSFSLAAIRAAV